MWVSVMAWSLAICLKQVQDWLKEVFAGEEVPAYEINSQTVAVLHHLAARSQKRAKLAKMTIEDLEQKTQEYLAECKFYWMGLLKNFFL